MESSIFSKIFELKKYTKKIGQQKIKKVWKKSFESYLEEKQRRNQIHTTMDYNFFATTVGQFLSKDALKIIYSGKLIAYLLGEKVVTTDMLLYGFFDNKNTYFSAFKIGRITKEKITRKLHKKWSKPLSLSSKIKNKILYPFQFFYYGIDSLIFKDTITNFLVKNEIISASFSEGEEIISSEQIIFGSGIYDILEYAAKIAKERFKTPIISSEILFIALLESSDSNAGKFLLEIIQTKESWLLLRYKFIRIIKKIEKILDMFIPSGLLYYDFLLRLYMSHRDFHKLLMNPIFHIFFVLKYRKQLLNKFLEINFLEKMKKQIYFNLFADLQEKNNYQTYDNELKIYSDDLKI